MTRRGMALVGVVVALIVAASGCGGGDDTTTATMTKAQFIARGDAICKAASAKKLQALQAAFKELEGSPQLTKGQQEDLALTVALPPLRQMADDLAGLGAPDDAATEVVNAFQEAVKEVEENPATSLTGNPLEDADSKAGAYGFKVCSQV